VVVGRIAQACKASELATRLSDTEIFLLVESEAFPKSDAQQSFAPARFKSPSIMKRVAGAAGVERAVDGLLRKGFGDLVHATTSGNTVKHTFHDVRAMLSLQGADAAESRTVHFVVKMRNEMQRICKGNQAAAA
jgi:hypothetical protein